MGKKTIKFNKKGIEKLPNDKPVVYKITSDKGKNNYTGIAKKGRVRERIEEHLSSGVDPIPGVKVQIEQIDSIDNARKKESNIISRSKPKYNKGMFHGLEIYNQLR